MKVILTGGGTGGHIYPALAIAAGLQSEGCDILYVGTSTGMEATLVPDQGWAFRGIAGRGLPRRLCLDTLRTLGLATKALWQAKAVLRDFAPDLVIGTGGYVSGPLVTAAALFGIPTVLHEQNAVPGITNRLLSHLVSRVLLTFATSAEHLSSPKRTIVTGYPVREEFGRVTRAAGLAHFGLDAAKKTLLVTGGSRGARSLNQAVLALLPHLSEREDLQLIWVTGEGEYASCLDNIGTRNPRWEIFPYLREMPEALAASDLCLCRSGAGTVAELAAAARAAILVPYPHAAAAHQEYNARALCDLEAAVMFRDDELGTGALTTLLDDLLADPTSLRIMGERAAELFPKDALQSIVKICLEVAWH
jgi:UDP-N-acetylglucosamine--N-acetylmuramyl-(pentapeptide) pyrophosphoryl-undecaprenol N-acetylglucosamine transferase